MKADVSDPATEKRLARLLLDVLIRAGLVLALAMLCYRVFSPFSSDGLGAGPVAAVSVAPGAGGWEAGRAGRRR
jgi:hypothetical protein